MEAMINKVIELACEVKEGSLSAEDLTKDSSLLTDAGLDSLQLINFILLVEDEYGMEFDFDGFDYDLLGSIESFCNYLSTQLKGE